MPRPRSSITICTLASGGGPTGAHRLTAVGQRGIDGIGQQIDQHLLQLVGIGIESDGGPGIELDRKALLEKGDAFHQGREHDGLEARRGQLRQLPVGLHEAMQRVGAALHDAETAAKVVEVGCVAAEAIDARQQAAGDGLDGGKGIRKLVSEHANQALPGGLFLFLKRNADDRPDTSRVWGAPSCRKMALRSSQRAGDGAEGTNGLIRRGQQIVEAQLMLRSGRCIAQ